MTYRGIIAGQIAAAFAALTLFALPVAAPAAQTPEPKVKIIKKRAASIGFFTPAASDAHRAALLERGGLDGASFRFTPSGSGRRPVTVAIRARTTSKPVSGRGPVAVANAAAPGVEASAYSLGASIGWKRFALDGDIARVDGGLIPESREMADLGVSYNAAKWSTRLMFGTERASARTQLTGPAEALSVDLGGSYSITNNLEVGGGLRYKSQRERFDLSNDQRRDSQAVYVGTAFRF
jgi:hypothetical protein